MPTRTLLKLARWLQYSGLRLHQEHGGTIVAGLVIAFVVTLLGAALLNLAVVDSRLALQDQEQTQAAYAAESGFQASWRELVSGTNKFSVVAPIGATWASAPSITTCSTTPCRVANQALAGGAVYRVEYAATKLTNCSDPSSTTQATCTGTWLPNQFWVQSVGTVTRGTKTTTATVQAFFSGTSGGFSLRGPVETVGSSASTPQPELKFGGSGTVVDSYNSCNGAYGGGNILNAAQSGAVISSNGQISITSSPLINTNISGVGNVSLSTGATVNGDITSGGTISGTGTVNGTKNSNANVQDTNALAVNPCSGGSGGNAANYYNGGSGLGSYIEPDSTCVAAGKCSYSNGVLTVQGGHNVTLAPSASLPLHPTGGGEMAPMYCFKSIVISGGSTLTVNGPVVISLEQNSTLSGGGVLNTTHTPANLVILSSVNDTKKGITLSGGSDFYGVIYMPLGQLVNSGSGDVYGAAVARNVDSSGGSSWHFDTCLRTTPNLPIPGGVGGAVTGWHLAKWSLVPH